MHISVSLYKSIVYVPTCYLMKKGPIYMHRAPIEAVPVLESEALRQAILASVTRGNPEVSLDDYKILSRSREGSVLEATGCKSDYKLDRELSGYWGISDRGGSYSISVDRPYPKYGWYQDKEKTVHFPLDTSVGEVIARLIAMIQKRQEEAPNGLLTATPLAPRPDP
jgi:hypothetical protein